MEKSLESRDTSPWVPVGSDDTDSLGYLRLYLRLGGLPFSFENGNNRKRYMTDRCRSRGPTVGCSTGSHKNTAWNK